MRLSISAILGALFLSTAAAAQTGAPVVTPPRVISATITVAPSWLHAGSDIPADPQWRTGTLPNGLRYAVRRNARPVGTIAIRVRMDVGGLMEGDTEQGWSHLVEHMVFRGTAHYADGEASKTWQRLGASFGSDTNAFTSLRSTTYVLDLPRADAPAYHEAMGVLAEMMQSARIDPALFATERNVVLAERAERFTPLAQKVEVASQALIFAGLKASRRNIIGTSETLARADAAKLRDYYHRWYRPERAVVVVVGDADPALLEDEVRARFSDWKGKGRAPAEPDYGSVSEPAAAIAIVADPQAPNNDTLRWIAPHDEAPWTIARQHRQDVEWVADSILERRIANAAEAGGAIINAGIGLSETRHIADDLSVRLVARPGQSKAALDQAFAVVNGLRTAPPLQAEVDQQFIDIRGGLRNRQVARATILSPALASEYVGDVDHGDVSPDPAFYVRLFDGDRRLITPDAVQAVLARQFAPAPRLLRLTSEGKPEPVAALAADLANARAVAPGKEAGLRPIAVADLKLASTAGVVASRQTITDLGIERVRFANGVTLDYKKTPFERDTIRLRVVVGRGALTSQPGDQGLFWSAGALAQSGFGPFTRDEVSRLTAGRRVSFSTGGGLTGVQFYASTGRNDVPDTLKLMTGALTQMHFAEGPVGRLRDQYAASYASYYASPASVLSAFGSQYFYGGDARFASVPPLATAAALTLPDFQRFWSDQLARGPIRVQAVGDLDGDALVAAVAASLGALPPRGFVAPTPEQLAVTASPPPQGAPILHHRGDPDQAAVARVYATPGVFPDLALTRTLDITRALIEARLTEEFREKDGGSYSPFVLRNSSNDLPDFGSLVAGAQLKPARIAAFQAALDRVTADLAANGPSADALARAKATEIAAVERARGENGYWLGILDKPLDDPQVVDSVRTPVTGRQAITAAAVQAAAARYLAPGKGFTIEVLPEAATLSPADPTPPARP